MAKSKAAKPASPKADKLKELRSNPKNKVVKPAKQKSEDNGTEPLSTFQTPVTGRNVEELLAVNGLDITYVSIDPDTDFLILSAEDKNKDLPSGFEKRVFKLPVHKKLKEAVQKLGPHAVAMIDHTSEDVNVTSVHFKHSNKRGDSIQINATIITEREKAFNYTTPLEYLNSDGENAYSDVKALKKIKAEIMMRVGKYFSGEERGDPNAIGMFAEATTNGQAKTAGEIFADQSGTEHDVTDEYTDEETTLIIETGTGSDY